MTVRNIYFDMLWVTCLQGPDYVEVALIWIDDQCANPDIFPDTDTNQGTNYPGKTFYF